MTDVRTATARVADTVSDLFDVVSDLDKVIARVQGMRAEANNQAVQWSQAGVGIETVSARDMRERSPREELACVMRVPGHTAEAMIRTSMALADDLRPTLEALKVGDISLQHAKVMVERTDTLSPDLRAHVEAEALPHAKELTAPSSRESSTGCASWPTRTL